MRARLIVAAALLLAPVCHAELRLYFTDGAGGEEAVGNQIDFGIVVSGDYADSKLRIRNLGDTAVVLETFRVLGVGFSLRNHPTIPFEVSPGSNVDFRVRFQPTGSGTYSATLRINDSTVMLFGRSPASLTLSVLGDDGFAQISSGDVISFGAVERKSSVMRRFRIHNPSLDPLAIPAIQLEPGPFYSSELPTAPMELAPSASVDFDVSYKPENGGLDSAALSMGERVFHLEGFGLDPVFPPLEILLDSSAVLSGQQSAVRVRLSEPPIASGMGSLRIEFVPHSAGAGEDPAVQFLSTGSRSIPLFVTEDSTEVQLDGAAEAVFQTGTTAGTIMFVASLGAQSPRTAQASVTIPPEAVVVDRMLGRKVQSTLEVEIAGYDNTQSGSRLTFRFLATSGKTLAPGVILADVTEAFRSHFQAANVGGLFSLLARFPVHGDISQVGAVIIQFSNSAGNSTEQRVDF